MPLRRYFPNTRESVVVYGEIVGITLVAMLIAAVAGIWLIGQMRSPDGLSGAEIGLLVAGLLSVLNQLGIWRVGAQGKIIGHNTDGFLTERLESQTKEIIDRLDVLETAAHKIGADASRAARQTKED